MKECTLHNELLYSRISFHYEVSNATCITAENLRTVPQLHETRNNDWWSYIKHEIMTDAVYFISGCFCQIKHETIMVIFSNIHL